MERVVQAASAAKEGASLASWKSSGHFYGTSMEYTLHWFCSKILRQSMRSRTALRPAQGRTGPLADLAPQGTPREEFSEKGEVLLGGVGTVRYSFPPNASVQWQPGGLTIHTKKCFLGAGFLGAPPTSLRFASPAARGSAPLAGRLPGQTRRCPHCHCRIGVDRGLHNQCCYCAGSDRGSTSRQTSISGPNAGVGA